MKAILSFVQGADENELIAAQQIIQSRLGYIKKDLVDVGDAVYFRDRKRRKISGIVVEKDSKFVCMKTVFGIMKNVPRDKVVVERREEAADEPKAREKNNSAGNRTT